MPCVLKRIGPGVFSAPPDAQVKIAIQKTVLQRLAAAVYNGASADVTDDLSTRFTVVAGRAALDLAILGHEVLEEDLDVVEIAEDGDSQYLYGYRQDYEADIHLSIQGVK